MNMQQRIETSLRQLEPVHLEVYNDSHLHAGDANESHFKVLCVADCFVSMPLIQRHRLVYTTLGDDIMHSIHALQINAWTVEQWQNHQQRVRQSSTCQHAKTE